MKTMLNLAVALITLLGVGTVSAQFPLPEPSPSNTLLPCEVTQSFNLLFTGTFASFDNNFATYQQNNNTNTALPAGWALNAADSSITAPTNTADIRSQTAYGDFDLRMSYKNTGNDGVMYKVLTRTGTIWGVGVETAIDNPGALNSTAPSYSRLAVPAAYDMFGASQASVNSVYKPYSTSATAWNQLRIVARGDSVEHWLNNTYMIGFRFWNARWNTALSSSKWATSQDFAQNTAGCRCYVPTGYIGFQNDHPGQWFMRNLRISTTNVTLGPAQCPVGVEAGKAPERLGYTLEPLPGAMRLNLKGMTAVKAELMGLDGKTRGRAILEGNGASVILRGWEQSGVGFLRVATDAGAVYRERIFLP